MLLIPGSRQLLDRTFSQSTFKNTCDFSMIWLAPENEPKPQICVSLLANIDPTGVEENDQCFPSTYFTLGT